MRLIRPLLSHLSPSRKGVVTLLGGLSLLFGLARCNVVNATACMDQDPFCNPLAAILQLTDLTPILRSRFIYVMSTGGDVEGAAIQGDGSLSPLSQGVVSTGSSLYGIDSSDRSLHVGGSTLISYSATSDGTLTQVGAANTDSTLIRALRFAPGFAHLYSSNTNAPSTVYGYSVDGGGALTGLPGSPYTPLGNSCNLYSQTFAPGGGRLYLSGPSWSNILIFDRDTGSGVLTPNGNSPVSVPVSPGTVQMHPSGAFLYYNKSGVGVDNIYVYRVDGGTGALTLQAFSPYALGVTNTMTVREIYITPGGGNLYAATDTDEVYAYSINSGTGELTFVNSLGTCNYPTAIESDLLSRYLYVAGDSGFGKGQVKIYLIGAGGGLTEASFSPYTTTSVWPSDMDINNRYD